MHIALLPKLIATFVSALTAVGNGVGSPVDPQSVPLSYFGINLSSPVTQPNYAPWPSLPFGSYRISGRVSWGYVETALGSYATGALTKAVTPIPTASLDQYVETGNANNVSEIYQFLYTPVWAGGVSGQTWTPTSFQYLTDFATVIASRYGSAPRPLVQFYEAENEFNFFNGTAGSGGGCPGTISACSQTAAQVATWAQTVYSAIKAVNSSLTVLSPSVTNSGCCGNAAAIMGAFLAAGGGTYADVMAFHCYQTAGNIGNIADVINTIQTLQAVFVTYGVNNLPLWDTECSYGPNSGYTNATLQAAFVAKEFLVQWGLGVARVYHYAYDSNEVGLPDPPTSAAYAPLWDSAGLTNIGVAYQQVEKWMIGARVGAFALSSTIYSVPMSRPTTNGDYQAAAIWDEGGGPTTCSVGNGCLPSWATQYRDLTGAKTSIVGNSVTLTASPILLETGSAW